nr:hypothetical protein [uncultured bacterium]
MVQCTCSVHCTRDHVTPLGYPIADKEAAVGGKARRDANLLPAGKAGCKLGPTQRPLRPVAAWSLVEQASLAPNRGLGLVQRNVALLFKLSGW